MLRIDVRDTAHPLPEIARALKKHAPKSGIRAVGFGLRRTADEHVEGVVVLRVVLRKKRTCSRRAIPESARLPKQVRLRSHWLGQRVEIVVDLDLEGAREAQPCRYALKPTATEFLCAAAYATWNEGGADRFGLVTAGHGLWSDAGHTRLLDRVAVEFDVFCRPATAQGTVRAASHLGKDGLDVGLVELPRPQGLRDFWPSPVTLPSAASLIDRLGSLQDLLRLPSSFQHFSMPSPKASSVAYYPTYRLAVAGWGTVELRDVVETEAPPDTFVGGTSGAGIVTTGSDRLALGLHGLCLDPAPRGTGENRRGLATCCFRAQAWLEERLGTAVTLAWQPS